ncbi:hypothetical protein B1759_04285 [Rubrivirga sp. SAORIC476]|uniref:cytochrome c oxidase assembly factor Coa1 family protein n=1 Tax=Rubrivirga sp. SAORIC476 TaxID=1961794 RepID=UPI000BA927A3|nr:cytochrome c oxidase assembly factor Coa1 family protein [Rubrivirga sp. SAORIC476]PAP80605.1 hypothetical protein B1759_04285 [Rubrivirga sp. SAORIC476]
MRNVLGVLMAIVGFALFMSVIWAGCGAFLKNNEAYERGLATALADPLVQETLGGPVRESWFLNGAIEGDGGTTRGSWSTRLRGEAASGTLYIVGFKQNGRWGVVGMSLTAAGATYTYRAGQGFVRADPEALPAYDIL